MCLVGPTRGSGRDGRGAAALSGTSTFRGHPSSTFVFQVSALTAARSRKAQALQGLRLVFETSSRPGVTLEDPPHRPAM